MVTGVFEALALSIFRVDDLKLEAAGSSKTLLTNNIPNYMVSHPRRSQWQYSLQLESQILCKT
jgi:hypothetical protein